MALMSSFFLVILSLLMVLVLAAEVYLVWHVRRDIVNAKNSVREFVTAPDDKTPSPLAQTVINLAIASAPVLADAITTSMSNSVKGSVSGVVRGITGSNNEAAEEVIAASGNPLQIALAAAFRRQMKKNPMLAMALSQIPMPAGAGDNNNHNHDGSQSQAKMGF